MIRRGPDGRLSTRARAKVNLTLAVVGRRADGYHDLESLVMFAAIGDELAFTPGGADLHLRVRGPMAAGAGPGEDNLVLKAAHAFAAAGLPTTGGVFTLIKRLPAQAGLGGGSADAAAALRLLATSAGVGLADPRLHTVARGVGADVPVCLESRARVMRGIGETLSRPLDPPRLPALIVHPGRGAATPEIFRRLGLRAGAGGFGVDPAAAREETGFPALSPTARRAAWIASAANSRNDLQAAAIAVEPAIGDALDAIGATACVRLVRMTGSGSAVFGLYDTCRAAEDAARALRAVRPAWWIKATTLS